MKKDLEVLDQVLLVDHDGNKSKILHAEGAEKGHDGLVIFTQSKEQKESDLRTKNNFNFYRGLVLIYTHIIPINDLMPHHESVDCPCNPIIDTECETLVVHNAFDGRDIVEVQEKQYC